MLTFALSDSVQSKRDKMTDQQFGISEQFKLYKMYKMTKKKGSEIMTKKTRSENKPCQQVTDNP